MVSKRSSIYSITKICYILLCLNIGFSVSSCQNEKTSKTDNSAKKLLNIKKSLAMSVRTLIVKKGLIHSHLILSGTIVSKREAKILAQVGGQVTFISVEESDKVKEEEKLVKLDDKEIIFKANQNNASLLTAKNNYERAKRLFKDGLISKENLEGIETSYKIYENEAKYYQTQLDHASIKAPIGGVITEKLVNLGDIVVIGAHLLTVSNFDDLIVKLDVSELEVAKIFKGLKGEVKVDAFPENTFAGKVDKIFPTANSDTRMTIIEFSLDKPYRKLKPGHFARVIFSFSSKENIILPLEAVVLNEKGNPVVYIAEDNRAVLREVSVGLKDNNSVEILRGLTEGEKVVVEGQLSLKNGMEVSIVK